MGIDFRDTPFGQVWRSTIGPKLFPYPDEKEGFELCGTKPLENVSPESAEKDVEKSESDSSNPPSQDEIVGWYGENDPENPQAWSTAKKTFTFFQICLLTFAGESYTQVI
jgi:DHA1 family multidrug resistance protein-like MFS transporter